MDNLAIADINAGMAIWIAGIAIHGCTYRNSLMELNNKELSILDATTGYYLINNTSYNDIVIMFIKGNNVYQITIYGIKQPSDSLFSIIGDSLSTKLLA